MAAELLRTPTVTNGWVKAFQIAMWIGIVQNLVMALPAIVFPAATLRLFGQTVPPDLTWVSAAAWVLVFLACMYIPAAWNPLGYRWTTWLSIFARLPGVLFFWFWHPHHYPLFGWIDSIMLAVQLPLWLLTLSAVTWPVKPQFSTPPLSTPLLSTSPLSTSPLSTTLPATPPPANLQTFRT